MFKLFGDGVLLLKTIGGPFNNSFGVVFKLYVVVVTSLGTLFKLCFVLVCVGRGWFNLFVIFSFWEGVKSCGGILKLFGGVCLIIWGRF